MKSIFEDILVIPKILLTLYYIIYASSYIRIFYCNVTQDSIHLILYFKVENQRI